jgi:hypothetical protein
MRTDAERLKELYERLDTVWGGLNDGIPTTDSQDHLSQEFLALLDDLARGAQSSDMWAVVAHWAGERA